MAVSLVSIVLCVVFTSQASAQFLAGQEINVSMYSNQLYYESAGSYQRILYEDAVNSTTITNLIWSEVYVAPCGEITADLHLRQLPSAGWKLACTAEQQCLLSHVCLCAGIWVANAAR